MSIFSSLRMSKKAAKEHKAKTSQQISADALPKAPYKHVPTHAAVDALSGAASSWKAEDRPRIMEHHKRRSMMTMQRAGSALSTRTYSEQSGSTAPAVPSLLRHGSYTTYNTTTWNDRGELSYLNEPYQKRNRMSRNQSFIDSGIGPSPLASKAPSNGVSPSGSSKSSLTDENLEIPSRSKPQSNVLSRADALEGHTSNTIRKVGDAPANFSRPVSRPSVPSSPTSPTSPITPVTYIAPAVPEAPVAAPVQKEKKRRWLMRGKVREIAVAS